jgi:hypothetical protein
MIRRHREPTLNDILSDPLIRDVMVADGVDPRKLAVSLSQIGRALEAQSPRRSTSLFGMCAAPR